MKVLKVYSESIEYKKASKVDKQIEKDIRNIHDIYDTRDIRDIYDMCNGEHLVLLNYLRTIETTISMWREEITRRHKDTKSEV